MNPRQTIYVLTSNLIELSFDVGINVLLSSSRFPVTPLFQPLGADHFAKASLGCLKKRVKYSYFHKTTYFA